MKKLLLLGLLLLATPAARADLTVTLDLKNGDKVSDVTTIVAHVDSDADIDKVEFQVDNAPVVTATSVPYQFVWDTLQTTEGAHTLTVTAYDSSQRTKKVSVSLIVDNGLSVGAGALAKQAHDALTAKDYDTARKYARRALKADPGDLAANRVLAGIAEANGDLDSAISTLESAKDLDKSPDAMRELIALRMRRALRIENSPHFVADFQKALDLWRRASDLQIEAAKARNKPGADGKVTPQGHVEIGDALMNDGRFAEAVAEYSLAIAGDDNPPVERVNRLALAQIMNGQPEDAIRLLQPLEVLKKTDAVSRALNALALLRQQHFEEARAQILPDDLVAHVPASLIVAAYADSVLGKRVVPIANTGKTEDTDRKRREAFSLAKDVVGRMPDMAEAQYALCLATNDGAESETALGQTLSLAPYQSGPILDYAAILAMRGQAIHQEEALQLVDIVLKSDPENLLAKIEQACLYMQGGRVSDAEPLLSKLMIRHGNAPDVVMVQAVYWYIRDNGSLITQNMTAAARLSPEFFAWVEPKKPAEFLYMLTRGLHYREGFFLTPQTLKD